MRFWALVREDSPSGGRPEALHRSLWVQSIPDRRCLRTCGRWLRLRQLACVAPPRRRAAHRPPRRRVLTGRSLRAALRGRDALRDIADPSPCFEGLAAKSRVITEGGCFSGLRGRNRDPPPAVQDAQAAVPEGTPLKAVQAGRRNRSAPKKVAEPEVLHGERYIEVAQALLASATAESTLHVRAYSFDGPGYVEAIELSLKKQQWQTLKRLESQEAAARLAHGTSIKSAYTEDNRDVRMGSGLRGLHHAKSILLEAPSGPELVAGSLNFTTSSKANSELGVRFSLPAGSNAAATWLTAFEAVCPNGGRRRACRALYWEQSPNSWAWFVGPP